LTENITGPSYPELVLGTSVEILDGAGELVSVVAWLEAISLRHKQTTERGGKQPSEL